MECTFLEWFSMVSFNKHFAISMRNFAVNRDEFEFRLLKDRWYHKLCKILTTNWKTFFLDYLNALAQLIANCVLFAVCFSLFWFFFFFEMNLCHPEWKSPRFDQIDRMTSRTTRHEEYSSSNVVRTLHPSRLYTAPQKNAEYNNNLGKLG